MNAHSSDVRIDPVALEAEAQAIIQEAGAAEAAAAAAPPDALEAGAAAVQVEQAEEGYKIIALAFVAQGCELFVPNWEVTDTERTDLSAAIVQALMLWFPDGLVPPKYLALLVIAGVGAKIAYVRRDPITGEMKPRHAVPAPATRQTAPATAAP